MIELHIFTNTNYTSPKTNLILKTYFSFLEVFGNYSIGNTIVWMDKHPNIDRAEEYFKNISEHFSDVRQTQSLSEGYVKAINETKADFLFILEHDWIFKKSLITNTLDEIVSTMCLDGIVHLRFNKFSNKVNSYDTSVIPKKGDKIEYCITNTSSNNPHLINVRLYREFALRHVKILAGSKGIEELLIYRGHKSAIYGPLNYPKTIIHLDGRLRSINRFLVDINPIIRSYLVYKWIKNIFMKAVSYLKRILICLFR